jgi:plastocyanin
MKMRAAGIGSLVALALIAAACGGGDSPNVAVDQTIAIDAKNVKFVPDSITIQAGQTVKLVLTNSDVGTEHDLASDDLRVSMMQGGGHGGGHGSTSDADSSMMLAVHAKEGETSSAIFKADTPGTYNIYCTIAGHKDAGMVGTITVTAAS